MPRLISPEALDAIVNNPTGLEPVNIISIEWVYGKGFFSYADRLIPNIVSGKLIELADLEAVLDISKGGTSTSVRVVLDDTDGSIKKLFDAHTVYGRRAIVYQWFTQIPIGDAFPIFEGVVASPITWSEGDRSFSFDIVSKIDDVEVGFTVEDGNYTNVPPIILNKTWPLVFGTVLDMPTLQMDEIPVGTTKVPIGIPDSTLDNHTTYVDSKIAANYGRATCLSLRAAELLYAAMVNGNDPDLQAKGTALENQALSLLSQGNNNHTPHVQRLKDIRQSQLAYDVSVIPIINGHRFTQNRNYEIRINGASYFGNFQGDNFNVISRLSPNESVHRVPGGGIASDFPSRFSPPVGGTQEQADAAVAAKGGPGFTVHFYEGPQADSAAYWACQPPWFFEVNTATPAPPNTIGEKNKSQFWFAQAGAHVTPGVDYPVRYIITIMPNVQVLYLSAKDKDSGLELITPIPPNYYQLSYFTLGSVTALIATFIQPLSTIWDQHWGDEVYATLTSPIGPNTVDILIWLIQQYTIYGIDFTSFNHVRTKVANYPSSFPILDKKNIVAVLKDIAWQARCALWISNNTWYIRYLPEQLTPVDTITENDIEQATMQIESSPTEELVTKFVATWKESLAIESPVEICLQSNVALYGTIRKSYNFWIYNVLDYVVKSATYWTMIYSNIWKLFKCKTFLPKLTIETLDDVTINLAHNQACIGSVVGTTKKATFNSADFSIDMEVWLPVRLGEMHEYPLAYPSGISTTYVFPDINDIPGVFVQTPQVDLNGQGATNPVTPNWSVHSSVGRPISDAFDLTPETDYPQTLAQMPDLPFAGGGDAPAIPQPQYDYDYRAITPTPVTPQSAGESVPIPAIIDSDNGDGTYTVDIFSNGTDLPSDQVIATVPGINKDASLPPGTQGNVTKQLVMSSPGSSSDGSSSTITISYIFQAAPFWITPEDDS